MFEFEVEVRTLYKIKFRNFMYRYAKTMVSLAILASVLSASGIAYAQTTTNASSTTPGAPNTGAGGDTTPTVVILGAAAAVLLIGGTYLLRKRLPEKISGSNE